MVPERLRGTVAERLLAAGRFVTRDRLRSAWSRYYWAVAGLLVAGGVLAMGRPFVRIHGRGPPLPHTDTVILEYVGWYVAQGNTLYTDIWEIKPPLAFLPSYLYAHLTGTNMYAHHLLGIATTTAAFALTAAFAARVVGTVTDSPEGGLAAAVALFALPDLFYFPWMGYKAKFLAFALGLAALDRAVRERHFTGGVLAGCAVGVWQLAVLFPVLTTTYAVLTRSLKAVRRHVAGGAVAAGIIGISLLLYADPAGFVAEAVLGPLVLETEGGPFDPRTYFLFFPGDNGRLITLVGAGGLAVALLDSERAAARPLALGGLLVACIVLVDFDGLSDTIYPVVFAALGVGILVSYLPRRVGLAAVAVLALVFVPSFAPSGLMGHDPVEMEQSDGLPPALDPEREYVYWTPQSVESCRFFGAGTQQSILRYYPEASTLAEAPCGDLGLYWRVTRHRLLGGDTPAPGITRSTPTAVPPTSTPVSTPTPEPTPPPGVTTTEAFDYRFENDSLVVTVPLANRGTETHAVRVALAVTVGDEAFDRCETVTLAGGERTTLRFRFQSETGFRDPGSVSVRVRLTDGEATEGDCR